MSIIFAVLCAAIFMLPSVERESEGTKERAVVLSVDNANIMSVGLLKQGEQKLEVEVQSGKFKGENGDEDGFYAPFVEFGHGGPHGPAAPHPFLQPAFDAKREEANQIIKSKLSEALDRALGKSDGPQQWRGKERNA